MRRTSHPFRGVLPDMCVFVCYLDTSFRRRRPGLGCCATGTGGGGRIWTKRSWTYRIYQSVGLASGVDIAVEEWGRPGQQNAGGGKMGLKGIFKIKIFDFKLSTNFKSLSQIQGEKISGWFLINNLCQVRPLWLFATVAKRPSSRLCVCHNLQHGWLVRSKAC